jgi:glutamate--cysteine ligase
MRPIKAALIYLERRPVTDLTTHRLIHLQANCTLLRQTLRGIEKEGLRIDPLGRLARTPHSSELGSALTHSRITTDYSEALLELITDTHTDAPSLVNELSDIHRYVYSVLGEELIWTHSMPAALPAETDIPIAWYGRSNLGMLKHVYRRGLAERYGKTMQCIAGIHYNFSLPDELWELLDGGAGTTQDQRSRGYIALIRNFMRYAWLIIYLFGATPALSRCFMGGRPHTLHTLDGDTFYLPDATSLRMSDLGYQNPVQSQLKLCYNDLDTFLKRLYEAVTQPWPPYEAIGTHRNGEWIQLNTHMLQIENEYYSSIRPKRTPDRDERPITALAKRGVQYVEVRCLDIDPYAPVGITEQTCCFMDAFLLFCAAMESPPFAENGHCPTSATNFSVVVMEGRKPGLQLNCNGKAVSLRQWGRELLDQIAPYAALFDNALGGDAYTKALAAQNLKLDDPELTPSARLIKEMRTAQLSFHGHTLSLSRQHALTLRSQPLTPDKVRAYATLAHQSLDAQAQIERSDTMDFDTYLAHYHAALKGL